MRFLPLILLALSACAPESPQVSREEYLAITTRTYPVTEEKLLHAVERVIERSDADYSIEHQPHGLVATKEWSIFALIAYADGYYKWTATTERKKGGTTLAADFRNINTGGGSGMVAGTSASVMPSAGGDRTQFSPALYHLLFARLDHELGKRADWLDCEKALVEVKHLGGSLQGLCPPPQAEKRQRLR